MTDKKFTDEEIIKALECHINAEDCVSCEVFDWCEEILLTELVLDLINRQKAEIERLETENKIYIEANRVIGYQRDQRDKEIDELQKQIDGLDVRENKIKVEAYKEFAERIRECCTFNDDLSADTFLSITTDIDCVLKEMVGEEE